MPGVKLSDIANGSIELVNFHTEMLVSKHILLSCLHLILPYASLYDRQFNLAKFVFVPVLLNWTVRV